jgi:hypothetical protein
LFVNLFSMLVGAELNSELYHQTIEDESPEKGAAQDNAEA